MAAKLYVVTYKSNYGEGNVTGSKIIKGISSAHAKKEFKKLVGKTWDKLTDVKVRLRK